MPCLLAAASRPRDPSPTPRLSAGPHKSSGVRSAGDGRDVSAPGTLRVRLGQLAGEHPLTALDLEHSHFWIRGVRYKGAIPEARVRSQAEQAEIRIKSEVFEGKFGRAAGAVPQLADFIEKTYLPWARTNKRSWRHDEFRSRALIQELGGRRMDQIGVIQIEAYKQKRLKSKTYRKTPLSPASVNRELELLSGVYTYALKCRILVPNPCQDVRRLDEDNERGRYLSREEEARLMGHLTGRRAHLRAVVLLAIHTGMRKGELLGLRWPNVDFARGVIHVVNSRRERTKGKKSRLIPMNAVARELLMAMHAENMGRHPGNEYVFLNPETGKPVGEVKTAFTGALEAAGIEDFVFHDLRRTAATRLGDLGANAYQIAAILGHGDIKTSQAYSRATDGTLRRLMDDLADSGRVPAKVPPQEERRPLPAAVNS